MAEIIKRKKALAVNPLKVSQPVGASLAFLGINRSIPMMHGSQGCTAFAKVFFVRHFREPIPLQTTAMDQGATVLGADENVVVGLKTIAEKSKPALIGLPTTGLSETQGTDIRRLVKDFRERYPEYNEIPVVPVNTPDFTGSLESGFALAVKATIEYVVPDTVGAADRKSALTPTLSPGEREVNEIPVLSQGERGLKVGKRKKQVNILAGSMLTPGDIEHIKELVEAFGLRPVMMPDIGDALDGHLSESAFSPLSVGGTPVSEIVTMGESAGTLVIGHSLYDSADLLKARTGVPDWRFDSLMGLEQTDAFIAALAEISGQPVPEKIERQRAQLQDAMVDTHFMLGFGRIAIAADPDLLYSLSRLVADMGCQVTAAVAPSRSAVLSAVPAGEVKLGDLEDLEKTIHEFGADIIICNSHAADTAERLGLPLYRAGFPQYDLIGGYQKLWVGYRGTRQTLFDLANMMVTYTHHEASPYRSIYAEGQGEPNETSPARAFH